MSPSKSGCRIGAMPHRLLLLLLAVCAFAVGIRVADGLTGPIEGHHAWRQTHVADNIEHYVSGPLTLEGRTMGEGVPAKFYDLPLYAWTVAVVVRPTSLDVALTARLLNLLLLAAFLAASAGILHREGVGLGAASLVLLLVAISPLKVYYDRAVMPDNLAVTLSFASLLALLTSGSSGLRFSLVLFLGALATLIKPPVHVPVSVAVALLTVARPALRRQGAVYLAAMMGAAAGFAVISSAVNGGLVATNSPGQNPLDWYFGPLSQRLIGQMWRELYDIHRLILPAPLLALAVLGFGVEVYRRRWVAPALIAGHAAFVLLFFNVAYLHSYYHLAAVLPVCWLAVIPLSAFATELRHAFPAHGRVVGAGAAVVCVSLFMLVLRAPQPRSGSATYALEEATALRRVVPGDAYLIWVETGRWWDPQTHYFAQRRGRNVDASEAERVVNESLQRRLEVYVFDRQRRSVIRRAVPQ